MFVVSGLVPNDYDIDKVSGVIGKALNATPNAGIAWNRFGMKLLRTKKSDDLEDIMKRCTGGFADRCQELLRYWKNVKATEGDGWDHVIEALKEAGLIRPATKLENSLKCFKQPTSPKQSTYQASEGKSSVAQFYITYQAILNYCMKPSKIKAK